MASAFVFGVQKLGSQGGRGGELSQVCEIPRGVWRLSGLRVLGRAVGVLPVPLTSLVFRLGTTATCSEFIGSFGFGETPIFVVVGGGGSYKPTGVAKVGPISSEWLQEGF